MGTRSACQCRQWESRSCRPGHGEPNPACPAGQVGGKRAGQPLPGTRQRRHHSV